MMKMKYIFGILLAGSQLLSCSQKENPVFCLSDEYVVTSPSPLLALKDSKLSKDAEGTALIVLSISDSLKIKEWDVLDLTVVGASRKDTLLAYSSFTENTKTKDISAYQTDIESYIKNLKITLKEGITQAKSKKIQITVNVGKN